MWLLLWLLWLLWHYQYLCFTIRDCGRHRIDIRRSSSNIRHVVLGSSFFKSSQMYYYITSTRHSLVPGKCTSSRKRDILRSEYMELYIYIYIIYIRTSTLTTSIWIGCKRNHTHDVIRTRSKNRYIIDIEITSTLYLSHFLCERKYLIKCIRDRDVQPTHSKDCKK